MAAETGVSTSNRTGSVTRSSALPRGHTTPPSKSVARRRSPKKRSPRVSPVVGASSNQSSQNPGRGHYVAQPPAWARTILCATDPSLSSSSLGAHSQTLAVEAVPGGRRLRRGDVVRAAINVVRAQQVPNSVLLDENVPSVLVSLLMDDSVFSSPADRVNVIAAIHAIASQPEPRDELVSVDALQALVTAAKEADSRARELMLKGEDERGPVWTAAVRTVAKLVVCSTSACATAIPSGALSLLAKAAAPEEDITVRVRAAAGLAAIAAWSGPRKAVPIVETSGVVRAMSGVLTERNGMVSNHLRSATMDGLVAMSFHRKARRILREKGCDGKITAAARQASMSGDYDIAARGTVAAGKLTGRSVDEFGFLVQAPGESLDMTEEEETPTGLKRIQELLLHEAYMQVEEIDALEMIVAEDNHSNSSSPRERQLVRDAARMYGVNADAMPSELQLERAGSPTSQTDLSSRDTSREEKRKKSSLELSSSRIELSTQPVRSEGASPLAQSSTDSRASSGDLVNDVVPIGDSPISSGKVTRTRLALGEIAEIADPDDEPIMGSPEGSLDEARSSSARSPLMIFSMGTKKAAERDIANMLMRKSSSQLNRDTEHERLWKNVLENHPEMLERGTGTMRRVKAYRELAIVPVPSSMRRKLWPRLLDIDELREAEPGLYAELCKRGEEEALSDETEHTIEADVTRTMPLHSLFWSGGAQVGVRSLRSILRAYARYCPEVGYCQGMSSVAAVFMMNARDEEDAFLMFVQFMEKFQYKDVFAEGFPQMLKWLDDLRPLIYHYMPELWQRLERENMSLELYADKWLITALSHNFPHRYLLRIWDVMFLGGSPKIIVKTCLAVLKSAESRLLTMGFEGMMHFLQRDFASPETGILDVKDPEPFVRMARDFRFVGNPNKPRALAPAVTTVPQTSRLHEQPQQQQRSVFRACFCFGRSQVID